MKYLFSLLLFVSYSASSQKVEGTDTLVLSSPTWDQAFHYAAQRPDYATTSTIGFALIAAGVVVLVGMFSGARWVPKWFENNNITFTLLFLLIGFGIYFLAGSAIGIRQENKYWLKKDVNQKAFFDSLANKHKLIDGPY